MKLFVVKVVNGNPAIVSEWTDNEKGAMTSFHDTCKTLWNADDVLSATVKILDEQLNLYGGKYELINKSQPTE